MPLKRKVVRFLVQSEYTVGLAERCTVECSHSANQIVGILSTGSLQAGVHCQLSQTDINSGAQWA